MPISIFQLEKNVEKLSKRKPKKSYPFDFLLAYDFPKSTVTLLRKKDGSRNLSDRDDELLLKRKILFRTVHNIAEAEADFDALVGAEKLPHDPRFLVFVDAERMLAYDRNEISSISIALRDLPKDFTFFMELAGLKQTTFHDHSPADLKAARNMARLYDMIVEANGGLDRIDQHDLNLFFSRLVFLFFAEDTGILPPNHFVNTLASHTAEDGSDTQQFLTQIFALLTTEKRPKKLPSHLSEFKYVNGGLFRETIQIPTISRSARRQIINSGQLDWEDINPDIFGSMLQSVVATEKRSELGMHYTSVPNIMKVIEPLFLNELNAAFDAAFDNPRQLRVLLSRLGNIRIFDPACGSGNFLITAYRQLRLLENRTIERLLDLKRAALGFAPAQGLLFQSKGQQTLAAAFEVELFSRIELTQFYGIEIDDFAHRIARLSLWLAEHQMNREFQARFARAVPSLPLRETGHIVHGNAARVDWTTVCPPDPERETYLLGNPPYYGARKQTAGQKADMAEVFSGTRGFNNLDYVSIWFIKAARYVHGTPNRYAFVATNSICQGEQVALLWPKIFEQNVSINFAHQSFKWTNKARGNAGVIVIIVGIGPSDYTGERFLFREGIAHSVNRINSYLTDAPDIIVHSRSTPLSNFPPMTFGNMANDNGGLILDTKDTEFIAKSYPELLQYVRPFIGSAEYIRGLTRYCLWLNDVEMDIFEENKFIQKRLEEVKVHRSKSSRAGTKKAATTPHMFGEVRYEDVPLKIIAPRVSSERRDYVPFGFLTKEIIISDRAQVVYAPPIYLFTILTSRMHMVWLAAVGGRLKMDYNYSKQVVYNTFPFPEISDRQRATLEEHTRAVLRAREWHSERTLAQLYDPDLMPENLRAAHTALDEAVDRCYRRTPFQTDEDRLAYLLKLYQEMKQRQTLFAKPKKSRKTKRSAK